MARQYDSDGNCRDCGLPATEHTRVQLGNLWDKGHCPDSSLPLDPREDDPWDPRFQPEAPVSQLFDPIE